MPPPPNIHAVAVILLTGVALFLFTRDRIPLEGTGLAVLTLLVLGFFLFPYGSVQPADFFRSFGHEALISISALLIVSKGLETTGALQPLASIMVSGWQDKPGLALLATLVIGAIASASPIAGCRFWKCLISPGQW